MTRFEIEIQRDVLVSQEVAAVRQAAITTLSYAGVIPPAGLTVLLTDDTRIHQFNRQFRGVDKPTDVLSFPAGDGPGLEGYLGDVAISVPTAQAQADAAGHPLHDELALLTVHGVLHLLGHDHADPAEKAAMWAAQAAILTDLGLRIEISE